MTPNLAKKEILLVAGFKQEAKKNKIYHIEDEDLDLIATAEITLVGMHTDEVLEDLPKNTLDIQVAIEKKLEAMERRQGILGYMNSKS